ncbi:MAG: bifunctional [glutamine synthetase] adenylyltransferase/[glutamine synthetase]-adenylyl-L-tyrosine phosphorylase [Alphaproteobacteria bacterium]
MPHPSPDLRPPGPPRPADPKRAQTGLENWRETAEKTDDPRLARMMLGLTEDPNSRALLEAVLGNSPFLGRCLLLDAHLAVDFFDRGPDPVFAELIESARKKAAGADTGPAIMTALRRFKRRSALLIALADLAGKWPLERITDALSDTAELALEAALGHLLRVRAGEGAFRLPDSDRPHQDCGVFILGVGKLGGRELNYSSDIDLIVLYDEERVDTDDPANLQKHVVRLVRDLLAIMEERTEDGYVFRTDLRLRPDPGATPLALSTLAAETYYESLGQNWERAAMIKARPVAGDRAAAEIFLSRLQPFIWRKNLDFAAIQDIHSIKRQINAHRGGSKIAVAGHDIKLGRGGIREIEFFAQTQQLIWGGRDASLRAAATCDALAALAAAGRIDARAAEELTDTYVYLRTLEHRLQMVDDAQTHKLPADDEGLEALAAFMGYGGAEEFSAALMTHMRRVESHYAELFEEAPALAGPGNLVFTGAEHDPDTIETLTGLGYGNAELVSESVRGWHHGRYRATRSVRARELLTELMPALLAALARTADPDAAFLKFDEFLRGLPAGVQLFSMFVANPELLDLVAEAMGSAPQLAERLSRTPALFEAVLQPGFYDPPPPAEELSGELAESMSEARDFEDVLDLTRRWSNDRKFQIGVHILRGITDADRAGGALADIADAALAALQPAVEAEFAGRHGTVPNCAMAVLAMGKLGGREMTVTSDLDLVFVYDTPGNDTMSDGAKPLAPGVYFARLSQRFLNAITAPTGEGRLYEVDMRLRPSGNAGPLALSLDAFVSYQRDVAWTWEHMALTRARVITGPPALCARLDEAIGATLAAERDADTLRADVAEMRQRILGEHPPDKPWEVKHLRGGLVDIEFIAQFLQLREAASHPEILATNTESALNGLREAGILPAKNVEALISALKLWRRLQGILRLTVAEGVDPEDASPGLKALLTRAGPAPDIDHLQAHIAATAARVHAIYDDLIGEPTAKDAGRKTR